MFRENPQPLLSLKSLKNWDQQRIFSSYNISKKREIDYCTRKSSKTSHVVIAVIYSITFVTYTVLSRNVAVLVYNADITVYVYFHRLYKKKNVWSSTKKPKYILLTAVNSVISEIEIFSWLYTKTALQRLLFRR